MRGTWITEEDVLDSTFFLQSLQRKLEINGGPQVIKVYSEYREFGREQVT